MHVIVVGCGRLGSELAINLDQAGHSVAIVDKNRRNFQRYLPERFSGRAVLGFGFDRDHLEQAQIGEASALAAVTGGDNSNILTARIARETYAVPNVVARIQDPRRAVIYERLGISTVAAVAISTDQVWRRLFPTETETEWSSPTGELELVERALPDGWAGHKLSGLSEGDLYQVAAVTRGGQTRLIGPDGVGQEGDILHVMVKNDARDALEQRLGEGGKAHR